MLDYRKNYEFLWKLETKLDLNIFFGPQFFTISRRQCNLGKKTRANPHRNVVDYDDNVPEVNRKIRAQRIRSLELMLRQISNYAPIIARNNIVFNSKTLNDIWQDIRLHYGFQSTGAHFLDFVNIRYSLMNDQRTCFGE